jgi:hypothetical protein
MMTLTRAAGAIPEEETVFLCANADHWALASAHERLRLHDHRWQGSFAPIPEHDYCTRACKTTHPLQVQGRPAFCPLADATPHHEWIRQRRGSFVMPKGDFGP